MRIGEDIVQESVRNGLSYLETHPALTLTFNVESDPDFYPPLVSAADAPTRAFDNLFDDGRHSGATYAAAFGAFLQQAKCRGYAVKEDPQTGKITIGPKP